jgi:hypothetical protein
MAGNFKQYMRRPGLIFAVYLDMFHQFTAIDTAGISALAFFISLQVLQFIFNYG